MIVYLPQDHTSGLSEGLPTPEAHVADNDLAWDDSSRQSHAVAFWPQDLHLCHRRRSAGRL